MNVSDMTEAERKAEFDRLFAAVPDDSRGERVRTVAAWCMVEENTVRIWSCADTKRVIPAIKLKLMAMEMENRGIKA